MPRVRDISSDDIAALAASAGIAPLTARCLLARGQTSAAAARAFLAPRLRNLRPPVGLADFEPAAVRIADAIGRGERIGVFGDYDVDGVTTAALFVTAIEAYSGRAVGRVARRSAGYGFGLEDAAVFADAMCHLIITGDCGTSDIEAITEAKRRGLEVIVVDHHTVPKQLDEHPATALVNPFRADSTFAFRGFASVGLAFYLVQRVRTLLADRGHFHDRPMPDTRHWLDLVALGTIADLVPLTDENRVLVAAGLGVLNQRLRPGLAELLRNAGHEPGTEIDARTIGWKIAPRLNAPGRLGDAEPALELLLATEAPRAELIAAELEQLNDERRAAQDSAYAEALAEIDRDPPGACVVVAGAGWLPGVVGIVAARLVDLLERPAFVLAIDEDGVARGSARTHGSVSVYAALAECESLVDRFGGHAAAAGLTMAAANLDALKSKLEAAVASQLESAAAPLELVDADVELATLLAAGAAPGKTVLELEAMRPFGKGNPELRFVLRGLEVIEARTVGAERNHLKLVLGRDGQKVGAIGFGLAESKPEEGTKVDVVAAPLINRWRGQERVELTLLAVSESAPLEISAGAVLVGSADAAVGLAT